MANYRNTSFGATYAFVMLGQLATLLVYTVEPLWRMRVMTLIGMTTATGSSHEYGVTVISALAWVIGFLLAEFVVNALLSFAGSFVLSLSFNSNGSAMDQITLLAFVVIQVVVATGGLYLFFRIVNRRLFRRLERVAFHE
jgi:hypothetical protein